MTYAADIIESVDIGFGVVALRSDSILTFEPLETINSVSIDELESLLKVLEDLSGGSPKAFYADNTHITSLGYTERKFIGDNLHRFALASGVKQNSPLTRMIGHTIMAMFPPQVPMRMFSTKDQAIEWLHGIQKEQV